MSEEQEKPVEENNETNEPQKASETGETHDEKENNESNELKTPTQTPSGKKRPKSSRKKTPGTAKRRTDVDIEAELKAIQDNEGITGRAEIVRYYCGHHPDVSISALPQWKIKPTGSITSVKIKLFFNKRHQKLFFFSGIPQHEWIATRTNVDQYNEVMIDEHTTTKDVVIKFTSTKSQVFGIFATIGNPVDFGWAIPEKGSFEVETRKVIEEFSNHVIITEKPWHLAKSHYRSVTGNRPGLFSCKQYLIHCHQPGIICLEVLNKSNRNKMLEDAIQGALIKKEDSDFATERNYLNKAELQLILQEGGDRIHHAGTANYVIYRTLYDHDLFYFNAIEGDYVICPSVPEGITPDELSITLHSDVRARAGPLDLVFPQNLQFNYDLDDAQQFTAFATEGTDARVYLTFRPDCWAVLYIRWETETSSRFEYVISGEPIRTDNPEYYLDLPAGKVLTLTIATKNGGSKIGLYSLMISSRNKLTVQAMDAKINITDIGKVHLDLPDESEKIAEEEEDANDPTEKKSKTCLII